MIFKFYVQCVSDDCKNSEKSKYIHLVYRLELIEPSAREVGVNIFS